MMMFCTYHARNPATVQCNRCARALCPACDHRIKGFPFCQDCIVAGVELLQQQSLTQSDTFVRRKTSPVIATLLSLFVPGLGAAYNGQTAKAVVHFALFAGFFQMAIVTDGVPFFVLGILGSWLYSAIDACRTAQVLRAGFAPDTEDDVIARRLYGNPLAWSVTLLVIGAVFLLHTLFGLHIPIRQFLPALLVALGAYILYDHLQRWRKKDNSPANAWHEARRLPSFSSFPGVEPAQFSAGEVPTRVRPRAGNVYPIDQR